jgi:hypothetical protein
MVRKGLEIKILGERTFIKNKDLGEFKKTFLLNVSNFSGITTYIPYIALSYYDFFLKKYLL